MNLKEIETAAAVCQNAQEAIEECTDALKRLEKQCSSEDPHLRHDLRSSRSADSCAGKFEILRKYSLQIY